MKQPNCRLYVYGTDEQLISAMRVLMDMRYAFYCSVNQKKIRVQTRVNHICREMEKEFAALGCKTERHYDR